MRDILNQRQHSKHYVLIGLCVHEGTWFALNKRIEGLKRRFSFANQDFELHVKQFTITIKEQDEIRDFEDMSWTDRRSRILVIRQQKIDRETNAAEKAKRRQRYRLTDPFIHLSRRERSTLLEQALDLVGAHDGIRLFGEAILKAHPAIIGGQDPVRQAFEQVVARFDAFLQRRHRWKQESSIRPSINNGLLILDEDYSREASIQSQFRDFRQYGHPWGKLCHVIDAPFFASSGLLCGLQLVDVCAYAVRRYLDKKAVVGSHEERNFL